MVDVRDDLILLILDIDETLVYATKSELDYPASFKLEEYFVYLRPGLTQFLFDVNKYFRIGIWSSASDDYVKEVVSRIIPESIEVEFVWGRSRCAYRRNFREDGEYYARNNFEDHYNYVKPLKKLKRKGYSLNRILIVDDTPHKSQDNYGNAIYPTEYRGEREDTELYYLGIYLKALSGITNIRRIEKRNWRTRVKSRSME